MDARELRKVFTQLLDFTKLRCNGSHAVYKGPEGHRVVLFADKRDFVCINMLGKLFRQAGADHLIGASTFKEAAILHDRFEKERVNNQNSLENSHLPLEASLDLTEKDLTSNQLRIFRSLPERARSLNVTKGEIKEVLRDLCAARRLYHSSEDEEEQKAALELFRASYYEHGGRSIAEHIQRELSKAPTAQPA